MTQTLPQLAINADRLRADFDDLIEIGATIGGGVSRLALSNEDLEARSWFANRVEEAGLRLHDDEVGNLSGILPSDTPGARTFLMGSHLDSVRNGGRYDGSIGVLAALEALRVVKEADIPLPLHLEAINFTDEEGTWSSFFGSMGLTGSLQHEEINGAHLMEDGAFRLALYRAGLLPTELYRARRKPDELAGYLELHIEQSVTLQRANKPIGIVTDIVGRSTHNFVFYGEAAHAATTPSEKRRDALQGAAIFITEMHRLAQQDYPGGIINCGNVHVEPGIFSIVPQEASLRVECRHPQEAVLLEMERRLFDLAQECAERYSLRVNAHMVYRRKAAPMDATLRQHIAQAAQQLGYAAMPLVSYAGHDAQILSHITPAAMIFIPSHDGISHNPKEYTPWEHVLAGANVLLHTMLRAVLP